MIPLMILPATCELCGQWMPQHSGSCPRNGIHPSQWSLDTSEMNDNESDDFVLLEESTSWLDEGNNCN